MDGGVLGSWIAQMTKQDIRLKLKVGENLLLWIEDENNSLQGEDIGALIDALVSWLGSSNSKIQQNGLEILTRVVVNLKEDFKPFISTLLPACIDRMGDAKERIRDTNADLLNEIMKVTSPQYILDRLGTAYSHKNSRVREEILLLMQDTIMRYTASSLTLSKFIPSICKLLDDPNAQVRETAMTTLVVIYRYVGDKLRHDLQRKYSIQAGKLQMLIERFDRAVEDGDMFVSPTQENVDQNFDEPDRVATKPKVAVNPIQQAPLKKQGSTSSTVSKAVPNGRNRTNGSGAVDEESFLDAFTDVPRINVFSARELEQHFTNIRTIISNADCDWDKRLNALKTIRSLVIAGAKDYDEFLPALKSIELPVQSCVKDLRSQIVREACITISYLCVQLNTKMDRFCELLLPSLILLMGATVKVMSSSGIVCIRFIIKHVHSQRLVPVIIQTLSTKNKEIRRHCFEYLNEILILWPTFTLERHIAILQQAIKVGLSDADQEARSHARKAFWAFAEHFKAQADSLLFSLDSSKQKMLHGEHGGGGLSNSSSSTSLHNLGRPGSRIGNSTESLKYAQQRNQPFVPKVPYVNSVYASPNRRANSAIDMAAARSSQIKAMKKSPHSGFGYAANEFSLPRTMKATRTESVCSAITSPERTPQQSRGRQVSQSQPNSRSASPSSRFSYITHAPSSASRKSTSRSRIPMPTSRDPSPSRSIGSQSSSSAFSDRRSSLSRYNRNRDIPAIVPSTPTAAERLLRNSREAEEKMAEILGSTGTIGVHTPVYGRQHSFGFRREDSDASSISSDISVRYEDVPDILANLGSVHWSDRKDGLTGLVCLLRNQSHALSDPDLQKITQTLTKMFMDPHTKVFALFLDTLNELITVHSSDLHRIGFLSILLTKLFIKSGQDLLGSVLNKISKTTDLIRNSFPHTDQFTVITRFINDPAHSSSSPKVKLQVLSYFEKLTSAMNAVDLPTNDPNMRDTFLKVTTWAGDMKNPDLQQKSKQVIISLYRVKTPYFSTVINQMAPEYQKIALRTIQGQLLSNTDVKELSEIAKPNAGNELPPKVSRTSNITSRHQVEASAASQRSFEAENSENFSPGSDGDSHKGITRDVATLTSNYTIAGKGSTADRLSHCVQLLASPMNSTEQKRSAIAELQILSKEVSLWDTETNFNSVFRVLLANLSEEPGLRVNILKCLTEIFRKFPQHSKKNVEEAMRKIISIYIDKDKDVVRMSNQLVSVILSSMSPDHVSKTCTDIVQTAIMNNTDSSYICTAIRILQSFIDFHEIAILRQNLTSIGPALTKSYDHKESSVRKASVFALVALHQKCGKDDLYPYLSQLPGCKLRLLNLYISRATSHESGQGDRHDSSPSSCSNTSNL